MINAIETNYAGCRFRSRLEARWAVFFDHLGIRWEYEPQGFELTWRLHNGADTPLWYLPDFYLPDERLWVEVKGGWSPAECDRFCNAAASLSSADRGGCGGDGAGNDVLVLGPVPRPEQRWSPWLLHMHKGSLEVYPWALGTHGTFVPHLHGVIAYDCGEYDVYDHHGVRSSGGGRPVPCGPLEDWTHILLAGAHIDTRYRRALQAARSARFEHGQSGAR